MKGTLKGLVLVVLMVMCLAGIGVGTLRGVCPALRGCLPCRGRLDGCLVPVHLALLGSRERRRNHRQQQRRVDLVQTASAGKCDAT